jgi:hypothetical protein
MNDIPGVPPPPAEVKVRTMRSDIASMTASGGGLPQFQDVTVAGLAMEREAPAVVAAPEAAAEMARAVENAGMPAAQRNSAQGQDSSAPSGNMTGIILVIVVAVIAIAVVGYFAYTYLGNSGGASPAPAATGTP